MYYYSKSCIGYNHINNKICCQDFSSVYHDCERTIITCCDGHGGKLYIRSDVGSKFASEAVISVFKRITIKDIKLLKDDKFLDSLKLSILCAWNNLVESDLSKNKIKKSEIEDLNEDQKIKLLSHKVKAYGTTLRGAMLFNGRLITVHIGDGETILIKKNKPIFLQEDEDEPVANVTYSMCEDDAYKHILVNVYNFKGYDGVILGTDGLVNPYQNYDNLDKLMIKPLLLELKQKKSTLFIDDFIETLAKKNGIGDDVSISFIINN